MYNLDGIELDLDSELLERYSKLALAEVGSDEFNRSLKWLGKVMLKAESFEKAVEIYGKTILSKKIAIAMEDELDTFTMEPI